MTAPPVQHDHEDAFSAWSPCHATAWNRHLPTDLYNLRSFLVLHPKPFRLLFTGILDAGEGRPCIPTATDIIRTSLAAVHPMGRRSRQALWEALQAVRIPDIQMARVNDDCHPPDGASELVVQLALDALNRDVPRCRCGQCAELCGQ